ncbi:MAG TPA: MFS transporter, partial [Gemmataceae bacterium]|nr:MFS transporter [Gemmataceae bacterium]
FAALTLFGDPSTGTKNWRGVFLLYGVLGLVAAFAFWMIARDTPSAHPGANVAEAARVPTAGPIQASPIPWPQRLLALVASHNMWLFGATQFFVNIGWAFLVTSLPGYLTQEFQVGLNDIGRMQTATLVSSCVGMVAGGLFADAMYRRLGPRWGRAVPIAAVMFLCAGMYAIATLLKSPWPVIVALSLMAFLVDLSIPSIWAFAQDVGGRHVGAALGFGNMLGNFGAAASPIVLQLIRQNFGWDVAFLTCAGCFVLAGVCGLNLNALIPVTRDDLTASNSPDSDIESYQEP